MALAFNPTTDPQPRKPHRTHPNFLAGHPKDCTCARCDLSPILCPWVEGGARCDKQCRGRRALGSHVMAHKRRKRKMAAVLKPDGYGYLVKVLQDPKRVYGLNLSALPRFAQSLAQSTVLAERNRKLTRRQRAATRYLLERAQSNVDGYLQLNAVQAPGKLIIPIALLAKLSDVSPSVVLCALVAYGLEKLATELRTYRTAPDPYIPDAPVKLPEA